MAKFTVAQIEEHAQAVLAVFEDGFQWSDFWTIIPEAVKVVGELGEMTPGEKKEAVLMIVDYVIDETDLPWLPDDMIDPILKQGARYILPRFLDE